MESLKKYIRNIPDFPKKGIVFRDITTLIKDKDKFREVIDKFYERYKDKKIDMIVSVESRGFIFGGALAYKLGAGFVPVRKKGKLPHKTHEITYDLEYGQDTIAMHQDAFKKDTRVLVLDDLLATGGTAAAGVELVEKMGGRVVEVAFLIELEFLNGRGRLGGRPVYSMIKYDKE